MMQSSAQVVTGNVLAVEDSSPLEMALVFWKSNKKATSTDAQGFYSLEAPSLPDTLVCSFVGYYVQSIAWNGQSTVMFNMQPLASSQTVVFEGHAESTRINSLDAQKFQTLTEKELCKAACCSLAESFETNASVDATYTDAITGTRQIKMLGLDGGYCLLLADNIPFGRGLNAPFGIASLPGPWIQDISLTKGIGSVTTGFEGIVGQIHVAHKGRSMKEKVFVNLYYGSQGRFESNVVARVPVGKSWSTTLFGHTSLAQQRFDMNKDGFLDNPLYNTYVFKNSWSLLPKNSGWRGDYSISASSNNSLSGQVDYNPEATNATLWGAHIENKNLEIAAKTGYVFNSAGSTSLGSQLSYSNFETSGNFGKRTREGKQETIRANILFAHEWTESLSTTSGISAINDNISESVDSSSFHRKELVIGAYTELKWNTPKWQILAGARIDNSSVYRTFFTPRIHIRRSLGEGTTLKLAAGEGYRAPNLLAEHLGVFAGNRQLNIMRSSTNSFFGLNQERAWNVGVVFIQKFKLNYREAVVSIDAFRTQFRNQVVVDWETPGEVKFYNLQGKSFSNNAQIEFSWSPIRRMDLRAAYRWVDARTTYSDTLKQRPLVAPHRVFLNWAFETKSTDNGTKWVFDATARWMASQRIPITDGQFTIQSPAFWIVNAQVAKHFSSQFELYIGVEDLLNYAVENPIVSANNTAAQTFDASMVWGPVFGRMMYAGLRWRIGKEKKLE
jgi:outer membrane receptor for ferrienterochelin and colicin